MPIPGTYMDVVNDITARVASGEYPPGYKLPAYRELANAYRVGMSSVARAIALLREPGVVVGRPGQGTYVAER
jgi:DNA-binding GntR family transcriptional regulator